ncbi:hypothetical protein M885DRAFT_552336 [Pelagophyceae sp. CCMP2097]|nr:hypothetical protein M885DRAFT_552336 [Pelagophyceae sp. CCMP2097]
MRVRGAVLWLAWRCAALVAPPRTHGAHGAHGAPRRRLAGGRGAAAVASAGATAAAGPRAATYWEIARFSAPLAAICVTNFAMGAIDTVCVGRFGGTLQLAALAPAVASVDYVCYAFSFLAQATLKLLADAGGNEGDRRGILSVAMALALAAGLVHGAVSLACAPRMVAALGASAPYAPYAIEYVRIRALSSWAYYLTMVGSAACFSGRDSNSPFVISVAAGALNFAGNALLCDRMHSATAGAAVATVAAQLAQCAATFALLAKREQLPDFCGAHRQRAKDAAAAASGGPPAQWRPRGDAYRWVEAACAGTPLARFVDAATLRRLVPAFRGFSGGISIATTVRICVYAFCGRACCCLGGSTAAAAHQIAANVWWLISSLCSEPFDAALLTFLPERLGTVPEAGGPRRLRQPAALRTLKRHLALSTAVGLALTVGVLRGVTGASLGWLVDGAAVLPAVPRAPVALACVAVGPMLVLEAALVALGCLRWLVAVICASAATACGAMVLVEQGRLPISPSPDSYWLCVAAFIFLRFAGNGAGVLRQCGDAKEPRAELLKTFRRRRWGLFKH